MPLKVLSALFSFTISLILQANAANLWVNPESLERRGRIIDQGAGLLPGDTLFIRAGNYQNIVLKNLSGSINQPIVVMNFQGQVRFSHQHYRGAFDVKQCKYLVIKGIRADRKFGFVVEHAGTGSAVGFNDRSTNIALSGFQILHAGFAGIMIKTDPDCDSATWRSNFVMRNVVIE